MQKNTKNKASKMLRLMIISAFLSALSIVLGKYLAINLGEVLRLSFENLPIIFAGAAFGSVAGIAVGVVADLLGCLLVGYAVNPVVTIGAATIGAVAGLYRLLPNWQGGVSHYLKVAITVFSAHFVGSVIIKTAGLAAFYAMPYIILLLWRTLNYLIIGTLEVVIISLLFKSKRLMHEISKIV